jgi:hypothetical protein
MTSKRRTKLLRKSNESDQVHPTPIPTKDIPLKGDTLHTTKHEMSGIFDGAEGKRTEGNNTTTIRNRPSFASEYGKQYG